MKTQMINHTTMILLCSLCIFTGCEKESLITPVLPGIQQDIHVGPFEQADKWDISLDNLEPASSQSDVIRFETMIDMTISKENVAEKLQNPFNLDSASTNQSLPVVPLYSYSVIGHATSYHEALGPVEIHYILETNPNSRKSEGKFMIASLNDRSAFMTFSINGSDHLELMSNGSGFPFGLKLVEEGGRFTGTAIYGSGSLTIEMEDNNDLEGVLPTRFIVKITPPGDN